MRPNAPIRVLQTYFGAAKASVVLIVGSGEQDVVQGSGFIVGTNQIATNFHVIEGREKMYVKFADGGLAQVSGITKADKNVDLAVLEVPTASRPPLSLGDELSLREGDNVLALGAPRGLELTLTSGIVSSFRRDANSFLLQTTAPIAPGSSGGPLLDSLGRVVGITTFRLTDSPGLYFSVAVSELKRLLRTTSTKALDLKNADDELEHLRREIESGNSDSASKRATALLSTDPENPEGLAISGIIALHQSHNEDAVKLLSRAVNRRPDLSLPQTSYSLALIRTGDFKRALTHARKAEELEQSELSEQTLALAAYLLNDLPTAQKAAEQVLAVNEDNETALEVLAGVAYWQSPDAPTWIARAKEVRKVDSHGSWALILDWREAHDIQNLKLAKAAAFPNDLPFMILAMTHLYSPSGADFKAADDELKPGLLSMPQNSRLLRTAIFLDLLAEDFRAAADHFSTLLDSTADPLQVHETGCLYYLGIGQPRTALQDCEAVVDTRPDNSTAHSNYGWAALDADEFALALQQFTKAQELAGSQQMTALKTADLGWGLLLANWWSGNEAEAKRLYDALASGGKQYTEVPELKKLPLVWSKTQLSRIQAANDKWHK